MGCGASAARLGKRSTVERQYSATLGSLRAFSSFGADEPLAVGNLTVLEQPFRNIKDDFIIGKIIGKGQFGTCRIVTERLSGCKFACKSISKRRLLSTSDVMDVRHEIQIMHHLAGHPNIVSIKDVYEDRGNVHIIEELCNGGELFESLIQRGHYSEKDAAAAFRSIASVVAHCHNMGVLHRDIKPENFLLSSRSSDAVVKGTDFGLSCFFTEGQIFKDVVGSSFYVAPDVLRKRYDKRADIWSLGVLLYILLCGIPPFYGETDRDIFQAILREELSFESDPWPSISDGAKDIVRRMLTRNAAVRATAAEVLQHDWVRENGTAGAAPLNNAVLQRLQDFAALNRFQQEALKVIATHLPDSEICGLRALFKEMDADGSGSITVDELRAALQRKGTSIPGDDLQRIMQHADLSGDGTLDYEEFLAATINLAKLEREDHLYTAFKFFDADDSGYITKEELSAVLCKVCTPAEIDGMMAQADSSGDGRIDYTEFCDLMRCGKPSLAQATRTARQGLMRGAQSRAFISVEAQRLRVESINPLDWRGPASAHPPLLPPLNDFSVGRGKGAGGGGGGGGGGLWVEPAAPRYSSLTSLLARPRRLPTGGSRTSGAGSKGQKDMREGGLDDESEAVTRTATVPGTAALATGQLPSPPSPQTERTSTRAESPPAHPAPGAPLQPPLPAGGLNMNLAALHAVSFKSTLGE